MFKNATPKRLAYLALATSALLLTGVTVPAQQSQFGTAEEAKAMLARAIPVVKADKTAAFAKFLNGDDGFKDRDLFVFCFNLSDGIFNAPGNNVGKDVRSLVDKNGDAFGQRVYASAKEGVITEVSYFVIRPEGAEPLRKTSFVTRIGDQGCGVGYFPK
jgi:signal transduction histidine kinase